MCLTGSEQRAARLFRSPPCHSLELCGSELLPLAPQLPQQRQLSEHLLRLADVSGIAGVQASLFSKPSCRILAPEEGPKQADVEGGFSRPLPVISKGYPNRCHSHHVWNLITTSAASYLTGNSGNLDLIVLVPPCNRGGHGPGHQGYGKGATAIS